MSDLEALILSGDFFNRETRSSSPRRSPSPDAGWNDDALAEGDGGNNSDAERRAAIEKTLESKGGSHAESIGMGPGRTGVKGVIRDRDEANAANRSKKAQEVDALNKKMEKASLGGKTFLEEEAERKREKALLEGVDEKDALSELFFAPKRDVLGRTRQGRFGHLREVNVEGYLAAVEKEEKGVWVVVHLFEPSLDRSIDLDDTLAHLARSYPDTKFLRCRASALGFASKTVSHSIPEEDEDEDPYDDGEGYEQEVQVDTDMLPTVLVYRDGDLVHNWVRVDWEAGRLGVEELLSKHHVLVRSSAGPYIGHQDDDELDWSD